MEGAQVLLVRPSPRAWAYVAAVAVLAAVGFIQESPWPILLAAVLAVPASLATLTCYYLIYGLLALVPGANPSSSSGSGTSAPDGTTVTSVVTGTPAAWFTITTHLIGVLALIIAALLNLLLSRALRARRHQRAIGTGAPPPPTGDPAC
jgi:hypothetical protein